jgi:hypothetical protein
MSCATIIICNQLHRMAWNDMYILTRHDGKRFPALVLPSKSTDTCEQTRASRQHDTACFIHRQGRPAAFTAKALALAQNKRYHYFLLGLSQPSKSSSIIISWVQPKIHYYQYNGIFSRRIARTITALFLQLQREIITIAPCSSPNRLSQQQPLWSRRRRRRR